MPAIFKTVLFISISILAAGKFASPLRPDHGHCVSLRGRGEGGEGPKSRTLSGRISTAVAPWRERIWGAVLALRAFEVTAGESRGSQNQVKPAGETDDRNSDESNEEEK